MSDNKFVDDAGDQILRFVSAAKNLSRLGQLTDEVVEIAKSGAWRRYRTAVGTDEWRECELDYFLIACDLRHEDISRVVTFTREAASLAEMMDREVDETRRRSLDEAAAAWHAPAPETLLQRAQRLGWTKNEGSNLLRAAPVSPRVRARVAHGMSKDEHAKQTRKERISVERRQELDDAITLLNKSIKDGPERMYVIDQLKDSRSL
jgi:hypothetical protein